MRSRWLRQRNAKAQWSVSHYLWLMTSSVWPWPSADISGKYLRGLLTVLTQTLTNVLCTLWFFSEMSVFCWSLTRLWVRPAQLCLFLKTLCSVLKYGRTAFSLNTQAGRFTLPPQPLSCSQVLPLLHCWASLAHDKVLLTQLHELSEKHKLNKLFGECP